MKSNMQRIAVTGGAGSGKSSVCRMMQRCGLAVIDLDQLARDAVAPGMPAFTAIVSWFGNGVLTPDGALDRRKLRECITRDPEAKSRMETWIHPEVYRMMEAEIHRYAEAGCPQVIVEFPLLFETGKADDFDVVIVVFVPQDVQISRLMARDHVDTSSAAALVGIQMPLADKAASADIVIDNSGVPEVAQARVEALIKGGFQAVDTGDSGGPQKP